MRYLALLLLSTSVWAHTPHVLDVTFCLIPPTENADGTPLELTEYRFCGDRGAAGACNGIVTVPVIDVTQDQWTVSLDLPSGSNDPTTGDVWYLFANAINAAGMSVDSNMVTEIYPFPPANNCQPLLPSSPPGDPIVIRVGS